MDLGGGRPPCASRPRPLRRSPGAACARHPPRPPAARRPPRPQLFASQPSWRGVSCTASRKLKAEIHEAILWLMLEAALPELVASGSLTPAELAVLDGAEFEPRWAPPAAANHFSDAPALGTHACIPRMPARRRPPSPRRTNRTETSGRCPRSQAPARGRRRPAGAQGRAPAVAVPPGARRDCHFAQPQTGPAGQVRPAGPRPRRLWRGVALGGPPPSAAGAGARRAAGGCAAWAKRPRALRRRCGQPLTRRPAQPARRRSLSRARAPRALCAATALPTRAHSLPPSPRAHRKHLDCVQPGAARSGPPTWRRRTMCCRAASPGRWRRGCWRASRP
jgi:hypothetical protein